MEIHPYLVKRLSQISTTLQKSDTPNYLVSLPANLKYLTGIPAISSYHRELFILLTPQHYYLYHSPLITIPQYLHDSYQIHSLGHQTSLSTYLKNHAASEQIGADFNDLTVNEHQAIANNSGKSLLASQSIIQTHRQKKDDYEIAQITHACQIASKTWQIIKEQIKPGISEKTLQFKIIQTMTDLGADQMSDEFLPIVAAGPNSAIPHHAPSEKIIDQNDIVLVDFGCQVNGYWSDMTRTIKLGQDNQEFDHIQNLVQLAYQVGYQSTSKHCNNQEADQEINQLLKSHEHQEHMPHTTGHNIGLEVHESPSLSRFAQKESLQEGMVFTIEPGIYLSGKFGYRHENTILYQNKELIELTS